MMEPQTYSTRKSELLGYFTFNTSTWDNDGTASLSQQSELLGYFTFNILLVLGIMMEPHNLQHQKSKLLGYFTLLNTSTCTWDNDGTAQPCSKKQTVGTFFLLLVIG
jgi:hypothetical protein